MCVCVCGGGGRGGGGGDVLGEPGCSQWRAVLNGAAPPEIILQALTPAPAAACRCPRAACHADLPTHARSARGRPVQPVLPAGHAADLAALRCQRSYYCNGPRRKLSALTDYPTALSTATLTSLAACATLFAASPCHATPSCSSACPPLLRVACYLPSAGNTGCEGGGGGGERRATKTDRRRKARGGRTGRGTGGRQKKKALGCREGGQASAQQWYWGYASALLLIKGRSGLNGQTRKGRGLAPWEGGGAAGGIAVGTARAGRCAKRMGITQGGRVGGRDGERAKRAGRAPAQQGAPPPPAVVVVHRGGGLKARVVSGGFWSGGSCWCARLQGRSTQPQAWRGRPSRRRAWHHACRRPSLGGATAGRGAAPPCQLLRQLLRQLLGSVLARADVLCQSEQRRRLQWIVTMKGGG